MYDVDDTISIENLCNILNTDLIYSQNELVEEIIKPEWSKLKHPKIAGFFKKDRPQVKMAILISKKNTLRIARGYFSPYYDPNDLKASAEQEMWRWNAFAPQEVRVMVVESFFKKNCLPYPVSLFPSSVINSRKVYDTLIGDIPAGVKRRMSLTMIQKATSELQKNPLPVAGGKDAPCVARKSAVKPRPSKKDQDRQDALAVAAEYWEASPELRPKQVAEAILENSRVEWRCQPPKQKTLRDWLAPHAPKSAKKTGRPSRIPK